MIAAATPMCLPSGSAASQRSGSQHSGSQRSGSQHSGSQHSGSQHSGRRYAGRRCAGRTGHHANFALSAMYAHRLWIKLWISLGHPAENCSQPEGKAPVTGQLHLAAHSPTARRSPVSHSRCARPRQPRAAQTQVIPGIHRAYDDYQFRYARQINMQVASPEQRPEPGPGPGPDHRTPSNAERHQRRRATGEDRP
jgi:hypothetical protein